MKLLLDTNLSWRLTAFLSEHFGECIHVNQTNLPKPAKDAEIWNYAAVNGFIIITKDSDFLNIFETRGFPPKIIWFRTGNLTTSEISERIMLNYSNIMFFISNSDQRCLEIY